MDSTNRPYVDPATEPGDAGTEPWADAPDSEAGDRAKRGAPANPVEPPEQAAIDGSPADKLLTEDSVSASKEDGATG